MSDIPKEWQTNKNLRYWISQQPNEEVMSTPEDFFLHESEVVKFAKQFHKEELEKLQAENERLVNFIGSIYNKEIGTSSILAFAEKYFETKEGKND